MSFFSELQRRSVLRVGMAYAAVAWLLIQIAETILPVFGLGDAAVRAVVVLSVVGLIPVVIIAWAFELTPDGLRRDRGAEASTPFSIKATRRLDRLIMVILGIGVAYFAFDKFVLDPARDEVREQAAAERGRGEALVESYGPRSIAVLPFDNLSADPEQEYFSDGIAEEILNILAKVPQLRVISRSSSFTFKGTQSTVPEIADRLGVAYVLEGSVRKAGNVVRVTIQLIDARADAHIWSETYDETFEDIFALQERIAGRVLDELHIRLLGEAPMMRRTDPEVWDRYLMARHLFNSDGDYEVAENLLKEALERDPRYVPALNLLTVLYLFQLDRYGPPESVRLSQEANRKALGVDPNSPMANVMTALIAFNFENRIDQEVVSRVEKALADAPDDPEVLRAASRVALRIRFYDDAIVLAQRALVRDPLCGLCLMNLWEAALNAGRYDEAVAAARKWQALVRGGWGMLGRVLLTAGRPGEALEACNRSGDPLFAAGCSAMALHELGRHAEADATLAGMRAALAQKPADERRDYIMQLAAIYARMGRGDEAMEMLSQVIDPEAEDFDRMMLHTGTDSFMQPLMAYPQWQEWLRLASEHPDQYRSLEFELPPKLRPPGS